MPGDRQADRRLPGRGSAQCRHARAFGRRSRAPVRRTDPDGELGDRCRQARVHAAGSGGRGCRDHAVQRAGQPVCPQDRPGHRCRQCGRAQAGATGIRHHSSFRSRAAGRAAPPGLAQRGLWPSGRCDHGGRPTGPLHFLYRIFGGRQAGQPRRRAPTRRPGARRQRKYRRLRRREGRRGRDDLCSQCHATRGAKLHLGAEHLGPRKPRGCLRPTHGGSGSGIENRRSTGPSHRGRNGDFPPVRGTDPPTRASGDRRGGRGTVRQPAAGCGGRSHGAAKHADRPGGGRRRGVRAGGQRACLSFHRRGGRGRQPRPVRPPGRCVHRVDANGPGAGAGARDGRRHRQWQLDLALGPGALRRREGQRHWSRGAQVRHARNDQRKDGRLQHLRRGSTIALDRIGREIVVEACRH
ncbi:hypothetical protein VARIO8X_50373 [Burkholderiales bacterium 8X]|nr:hypothetical protein VARIO8X_50373 [Burkholderiales bacterium 8X]